MRSDSPRVAVLHVRGRRASRVSTHRLDSRGLALGRDVCLLDPLVSVAHGTLECTPQHGVWVYVDHSERGTMLNHKLLVHRDAAIVRDGDVLSLGETEISLGLKAESGGDCSLHDERSKDDNQLTVNNSPSPPPIPLSQLARQMLPNIETASRLEQPQQPPPEYINSPIPGNNWRKKRHSISHIARLPMQSPGASTSTSQTFTRSKPLVPSAPSTPPQKDAPAARHVAHHAVKSPHSPYHHVKFKEDPETIAAPQSSRHDHVPSRQQEIPQQKNQASASSVRSPPLEYSSSPITSAAALSFLNRLHLSPPAKSPSVVAPPTKPSPPATPAKASPFPHTHAYDAPPARATNRAVDLRIQVAKRNAGLASAAAAAKPIGVTTTTAPTSTSSNSATTRPAVLSRGITIPISSAPRSDPLHHRRRLGGGGVDGLTPPASPVAHQDILRQNQSFLNIIQNKYKEEEKLKREQEEWMRRQYPAAVTSPSGVVAVPSMSPIRHEKDGSLGNNEEDDDDATLLVPAKAPALLRTVSLGQTYPAPAHIYHQPSPRLTQAVLASRARKGSFDSGRRGRHEISGNKLVSPQSDSPTQLSRTHSRARTSSGDSSVASSVSTEPSNHRRVVQSLSFTSSRAASSGELSEFIGYDDDDASDGLLSFTTYYGPSGGLDETIKGPLVTEAGRLQLSPHHVGLRSRVPSLDDEMAGVLNSPSHSYNRSHTFNYSSSQEPKSVAKPRPRSADRQRLRRMHQLGIDIDRSPTHG